MAQMIDPETLDALATLEPEGFDSFGQSLQQNAPQMLQSGASGAATGAAFGPYGALAGFGLGVAQAALQSNKPPPRPAAPPASPPPPPAARPPAAPTAPGGMPTPAPPAASAISQLPPELVTQLLALLASAGAGGAQPAPSPSAPAAPTASPAPGAAPRPTPSPPPAPPARPTPESEAESAVEWLMSSGALGPTQSFRGRASSAEAIAPLPPLSPTQGGRSIGESLLLPADIIVSTTDAAVSRLIQFGTSSAVSHAGVYVGAGEVVEALGAGVIQQPLRLALGDDTVAVALRHPRITDSQQRAVVDFVRAQRGRRYDYAGVFVEALFGSLGSPGLMPIYLGTDHDERFFCSELVLEAYERAGLPLVSPIEGRTPGSLARLLGSSRLLYVGHLKP
jgi:hypothetical protein